MQIRHEVLLDDFRIDAEEGFATMITLPNDTGSVVELHLVPGVDRQAPKNRPSLLLRQETSVEVDVDLARALMHSLDDRVRSGYTSKVNPCPADRVLKRRTNFSQKTRAFHKMYPEWIGKQRQYEEELTRNALVVINLIRWRFGMFARRAITDNRILLLRADAKSDWAVAYSTRDDFWLHLWPSTAAMLNHDTSIEIQDMLTQGKNEPLARDLLREAHEHRRSNPRSSLVIGIAASEVGLKRFFADRLPSWSAPLIIEAQQLPVLKLMRNVLPALLQESHQFKDPRLPKTTVISPIQEGAEFRNVAVHQPPDSKKSTDLNNYLATQGHHAALRGVSDLLYFLDYFSGEEWAIDNVSRDSRDDWFKRNPSS